MSALETIFAPSCTDQPRVSFPRWSLVRLVLQWMAVARSRRELASLTDDQLKDIGLKRSDVLVEIEKPFWQGPDFR
ncbi:DUF1127 domain-containing protein [Roseibium sp.]|uniref:DUF1127 domain-containing protein n=1 Tax=Roseibium sp. TaxID=1936156 RepID=UPI003D0FBFE4